VNISAIARQRDDHDCDHALVAGPDFPTTDGEGSALVKEITQDSAATGKTITLIRIVDLARLVRLVPLKRIGLDRLRDLFQNCVTPEIAKEWVDKLADEKVKRVPYKDILETIWEQQGERSEEAVEYSALAVALQKGSKHLNISKVELTQICAALSRMAPEMVSARRGSVELSQRPDKVMGVIGSVIREYPEEETKGIQLKPPRTMQTESLSLHPVHPFPARMAPSIVQRRLGATNRPISVLDPMSGSGTTIVAARLCGHRAIGFDTDPLAILIAETWSSDIDPARLRIEARRALTDAADRYHYLTQSEAYPADADDETRAFVRFWFDGMNRRQLAALSIAISQVKNPIDRNSLWCAFSRLIITKQAGASLAMDVSHSRPHKVYDIAPVKPLKGFLHAVDAVLKGSPFSNGPEFPKATVRRADARKLPLGDETVDLVITSPPYLNAIDYLRGHKFSLVWMGYKLGQIRGLRSENVGTERSLRSPVNDEHVRIAMKEMGDTGKLSERLRGMLARYVCDMNLVLAEISRVLRPRAETVLVVGDSTIRGVFVQNSRALTHLSRANGLTPVSTCRRPLLENRRYLPPPQKTMAGDQLGGRMREEVILTFRKSYSTA